MSQPSMRGRRLIAGWWVTCCLGCSQAPVFGESAGGSTSIGATITSSGDGPSGVATTTTATSAGGGGEGGGGPGGSGGEGPGGGGSTGAGCVSDCGERRCGLDVCGDPCGVAEPTWVVTVPQEAARLVLHPESSSLFVLGELDRVDRLDACSGEVLAAAVVAPGRVVRGAGVVGDELLVGANDSFTREAVHRLDRRTLEPTGAPIELPAPMFFAGRIAGGAVHEGQLWLTQQDDGDAVVVVDPATGSSVVHDFDTEGEGRGGASSPFGFVHQRGDGTLALFELCPSAAECSVRVSPPLPVAGFQVAYGDGSAFVPALDGDRGALMRVPLPDMGSAVTLLRNVGDGLDGFTDAAVRGATVYVSGVSSGLAGLPWVLAFPTGFDASTAPSAETFLVGEGDAAWAIAVDELGVYVAGSKASGDGFVARCTHALVCPPIPASMAND